MPPLDNLSITLGRVLEGIDTLKEAVGQDRVAAAQYRTDLRAEIAKMNQQLVEVKSEVREVKGKIQNIEPDIADYRKNRERITGAWTWSKALWIGIAALGGAVFAAGSGVYQIVQWLAHLPHTPPPPP